MKRLSICLLLSALAIAANAQEVTVNSAKFCVGDQPAWSAPAFNDSAWQTLTLDKDWNQQGVRNANGYGWYRIHVVIPSSLKKGMTDKVLLDLGIITQGKILISELRQKK